MTNRILVLVLFAFMIIGASTSSVEAQERVVSLEKGLTVWEVLREQGCSVSQTSRLLQLVLADSGLDPANDKAYSVGTPIVVRRDCQGNPLSNAALEALVFEKQSLLRENAGLREELKTATSKIGVLEGIAANISTANSDGGDVTFWVAVALAIILIGVVALWVMQDMSQNRRYLSLGADLQRERWKNLELEAYLDDSLRDLEKARSDLNLSAEMLEDERLMVATPLAVPQGSRVFPPEVIVNHHGKSVIFTLMEDTGDCKIWYKCPECSARLSSEKNCTSHMRKVHSGVGRPDGAAVNNTHVFNERISA